MLLTRHEKNITQYCAFCIYCSKIKLLSKWKNVTHDTYPFDCSRASKQTFFASLVLWKNAFFLHLVLIYMWKIWKKIKIILLSSKRKQIKKLFIFQNMPSKQSKGHFFFFTKKHLYFNPSPSNFSHLHHFDLFFPEEVTFLKGK